MKSILLCLFSLIFMSCTNNGPTNPMDIVSDQIILTALEKLNNSPTSGILCYSAAAERVGSPACRERPDRPVA